MEEGELPANSKQLFMNMIGDLNDLGIIHGDLHEGNIMYDPGSNRLWPIDISNLHADYYSSPDAARFFLDLNIEQSFRQVMKPLPPIESESELASDIAK